ncbi:uncharacterized protein EI97DRAFT_239472 [Westerdykella ornata]|uniref:Uncharacterized protein n=1 Tax=Westerdykella ornata TaxID=318751 RepID=A0A6A6J637_WESOR|nr:uncharacterized protein EI97DRAFT_239472 [Westerdykella ornata]KAF2271895.1 hypothetical protein EI97DRAFT_239472 [Westerdykella ornata]
MKESKAGGEGSHPSSYLSEIYMFLPPSPLSRPSQARPGKARKQLPTTGKPCLARPSRPPSPPYFLRISRYSRSDTTQSSIIHSAPNLIPPSQPQPASPPYHSLATLPIPKVDTMHSPHAKMTCGAERPTHRVG